MVKRRSRRRAPAVQVAVPADLIGRVKGARGLPVRKVEEPLGAGATRADKAEARARILRRFEAIRAGLPLPDAELERVAEEEHRRAFDSISARYLEFHGRLDDLDIELGIGTFDDDQPNPLFGGATTDSYSAAKLQRLGREPTREAVVSLSATILRAQRAAVESVKAGRAPPPLPNKPHIAVRRAGTAPHVSELVEPYLKTKKGLAEKTRKQARASIQLFVDFAGDPRVDAIDRATVAAWADKLDSKDAAAASVNKHVSMVGGLWLWAKDKKAHIDEGEPNPFLRHHRKVDDDESTWLPFNVTELRKLLRPSPIRCHILVALFSGMRASEIPAADLKGDAPMYFEIAKGKTKAARRRIPVAEALRPWIKEAWPEIRKMPGDTISEKFTALRRACGIKDDERKKFHSLRKNFNDALVAAEVDLTYRQALMGHKSGSLTDSIYLPNGPRFGLLVAAVGKVEYPGLWL